MIYGKFNLKNNQVLFTFGIPYLAPVRVRLKGLI
jgi:hypothetical protein